jgi:hypothetical protein
MYSLQYSAYSGLHFVSIKDLNMKHLEIPFEVADGITKANLIESRNYLQSELDRWNANPKTEDNPNGYWLHPEDVGKNYTLIRSMNLIIDYYGGEA